MFDQNGLCLVNDRYQSSLSILTFTEKKCTYETNGSLMDSIYGG